MPFKVFGASEDSPFLQSLRGHLFPVHEAPAPGVSPVEVVSGLPSPRLEYPPLGAGSRGRSPPAPLQRLAATASSLGYPRASRARRAAAPGRGQRICREPRPRGAPEGGEHRPPSRAPPLLRPLPVPAARPSAPTHPPHSAAPLCGFARIHAHKPRNE